MNTSWADTESRSEAMRTSSVLLIPLLFGAAASTVQNADPPLHVPDTVQMLRDIPYAGAGAEALALDLFVR